MKKQELQFPDALQFAILNGVKVQTRRILKPQPSKPTTIWYSDADGSGKWVAMGPTGDLSGELRKTSNWITCPYGKSGDSITLSTETGKAFTTAVIVGIRIQRLQNLSEADARAEGGHALLEACAILPGVPLQTGFALAWCDRYGSHAWNANPWVWVVEFRCTPTEQLAHPQLSVTRP